MNDVALMEPPAEEEDGAELDADDGAELDAEDDSVDDDGAELDDDGGGAELDGELELLAPLAPLLLHAATTRLAATRAADQASFLATTLIPFCDGGTCHLWAHCRIALA